MVPNFITGAYITLPKRTIGGEVKYDAKRKDNSVSLKVEADLHINKGKAPKLCLIAGSTALYDKGQATLAGELKATHPSLGKVSPLNIYCFINL